MVAHSISKRSLKSSYVRNLGTPSEQQALMVKIEWTKAPVVTVTVQKNFQMTTFTMSISKKTGYRVISTQQIPVQVGMKFYFVRSSEDGWYYILRMSENFNQVSCSCPGGRIRHSCKHIDLVSERVSTRPNVAKIIPVEELKKLIAIAEEMGADKRQFAEQKQAEVAEVQNGPNYNTVGYALPPVLCPTN